MYQVDEDSVVNSQKRSLIVELMKYIVTLKSYSMNQLLKPLVVTHYLELKNIEKQENKGILVILKLMGDPENIVEEVLNN